MQLYLEIAHELLYELSLSLQRASFLTNEILVDGRVFVAGHKTKGSPVGVMTVSNEEGDGGPLLRPYPNWDWWSDCESNKCITGYYRLRVSINIFHLSNNYTLHIAVTY